MGIGFVLIGYYILIGIIGGIIAAVATLTTYLLSKKENRKRNIVIAVLSPFIVLYTFVTSLLIGLIIVSENKGIDVGIGDCWYVPLSENSQLLFIDIPDAGYIEYSEQPVISGVTQLQQINNIILGKTNNDTYFVYNTTTNNLNEFKTENELISKNSNIKPNLIDANTFYSNKRNDIAGNALLFATVSSLIISLAALFLTVIIIVKLIKVNIEKPA